MRKPDITNLNGIAPLILIIVVALIGIVSLPVVRSIQNIKAPTPRPNVIISPSPSPTPSPNPSTTSTTLSKDQSLNVEKDNSSIHIENTGDGSTIHVETSGNGNADVQVKEDLHSSQTVTYSN